MITKLNNVTKQPKKNLYNLDFEPQLVDKKYLENLGVEIIPNEITLRKLENGSKYFRVLYDKQRLYPNPIAKLVDYELNDPPVAQTYTGVCPANVFRLDPVRGCYFGCLYCLDTDGSYDREIVVYKNYDKYVKKYLKEKEGISLFYYLSPVTDPFQEPILETGVIHNILREFILHYKQYPESTQNLFFATKAGLQHILFKHKGNSILDLLSEIPANKMQFNVSIGLMPENLIDILEPNAADINDRLRTLLTCRQSGITAYSVLTQPILGSYLSEETINKYFSRIKPFGVTNFKPEFATITLENLAIIGQLMGYFDKCMEKRLYELYIHPDNQDNKKGLCERLAPNRTFTHDALINLKRNGERHGMTMTLCNWIRKANKLTITDIPILENKRNFPCL